MSFFHKNKNKENKEKKQQKQQKQKEQRLLLLLLVLMVTISGIWYSNYQSNESFAFGKEANPDVLEKNAYEPVLPETLKVEIKGAVNQPNVYKLPIGSTVNDLIALAGGLTNDACASNINFSDAVFNKECITIPKTGESPLLSISYSEKSVQKKEGSETSENKVDIPSKYININEADKYQLQTLPSIGEKLSESIIKYREENGKFQSIEEIKNVSKIGDKIFEQIKDKITVE